MTILDSPTWTDVRARILMGIEQEKRANAPFYVPIAFIGMYSPVFQPTAFHSITANEDSYEFLPKASSALKGLP